MSKRVRGIPFRAHELISMMFPDTEDYSDAVSAIKFDLGDMDSVLRMADLSTAEFMELPAENCLFQVTVEKDVYIFLAKKFAGGAVWRCYGKQENMGFRWAGICVEVFISRDHDGLTLIAKEVPSGAVLANGREGYADLPDHHKWAIDRVTVVAMAIEVFSCSNVVQVENPPPKHINAKRKARGKVPFFSYRTIHISGETNKKQEGSGGTHASPRLHFRRGHIRRMGDGRRIWVRDCLVGDKSKGFAGHDYTVT